MKKKEKILFLATLVLAAILLFGLLWLAAPAPFSLSEPTAPTGARLDLNTADTEALDLLPGIGPVLSEAILTRRAELGSFSSREDILSVPGMGEARLSAIEAYITY